MKNRLAKSRERDQRSHARRRALQRFGVVLTEHHEREIIRQIREGRSVFVEAQDRGRTLHRVELPGGEHAIAVFNKAEGHLVSFLPLAWKGIAP